MNSEPPRPYQDFVGEFPKLGEAWDLLREAESSGPLDLKTRRLLKLAIAIGGERRGAVSSGVRKAMKAGASVEEIKQVLGLAASTIGLPSTVAAYCWAQRHLSGEETDSEA